MTDWTEAADYIDERDSLAPSLAARYVPGALAFTLSAALGVYLVYLRPGLHNLQLPLEPAPVVAAAAPNPFGALAPLTPPPSPAVPLRPTVNPFGDMVTQGFGSTTHFEIAEAPAPLPPPAPVELRQPAPEVADAPLPPRRPSLFVRSPEPAPAPAQVARATPAPERAEPRPVEAKPTPVPSSGPNIFEKLFGGAGAPAGRTSQGPALAYAAPPPVSSLGAMAVGRGGASPSGNGFGGFLHGLNMGSTSSPAGRFGDHVAVYDISARAVYLPDGTKLEAHSGLGSLRDDPGGVTHPMRGATPPATYALSAREELFHGVAALRLTPLDSNIYGRAGLLAHTYMLGPDGDSNGCVSFRDYEAFLRAFRSGQITKLVVVSRL